MLDQSAHETFEGTENRAVHHYRTLEHVVGVVELDVEALGQIEVHLHGRSLPLAAESVADLEVDLRPVEHSAAGIVGQCQAAARGGGRQSRDRVPPHLIAAERLLGPRGQVRLIGVAEGGENLVHQLQHADQLVFELPRSTEDVRVVLGEAAHAQHAVQGAARFVAVNGSQFREAQRQIAVGVPPAVEDGHVTGAVHRFDPVRLIVDHHRRPDHVGVVFEVAAALEHRLASDVRGVDRPVAARLVQLPPPLLEPSPHVAEARMPEHQSGAELGMHREQVEILAQPPVIARGDLLEVGEVLLEIRLRPPRGAVDALEHRLIGIAAPIRAGHRSQFETVARNLLRVLHVRPFAEVRPGAVIVEGDLLTFGDRCQQLQFELLAGTFQPFGGGGAAHGRAAELTGFLDDLAHLVFDARQILVGQRPRELEVVVEAVVDRRTDRDLAARKQAQNRVSHHVRDAVTERVEGDGTALRLEGKAHEFNRDAPDDRSGRRERDSRPPTAIIADGTHFGE